MGHINVARSMVQQYLPQDIQKHFNQDTLGLCSGSFIDADMKQTHSDMLYSLESPLCQDGCRLLRDPYPPPYVARFIRAFS